MCISFSRDRKNKNRACLLSTTNEDPWRFLLNIMESVYILHCLEVIAPSKFLCSSVLTLPPPPRRVTKTWVEETIIAIIKITITIITIIMKLILKARFYFVLFYFFFAVRNKENSGREKRREICCGFEEKDSISWWCQICLNLYIYIYI